MILLSATQIELWRDCKRKWGFKYLDRIVTPPHPAALLGTEVQDEQIDPYLLTGRGFDFSRKSGEIAHKLAPLLPPPMTPGMKLRRKFLMPSPSGTFSYQGEFDIWARDSGCVPGLAGGVSLLADIKTTSNLTYAKTTEKLRTDTQAQLYAMAIMFEDNVDVLDAVWFYTRTRGAAKAERHHARLVASHVAEQFSKIDAIGVECANTKVAAPKASELEPNPRMCDAYGGCQFRHVCNLSPAVHSAAVNQEEIIRNMGTGTADFLTQLRKNVGAPVAPVAATPPAPPATPSPAASLLPSWAIAPVDPMHARHGALINPPEAALPPAPPVGVTVTSEAPTQPATPGAKRIRRTKAEMEAARQVDGSGQMVTHPAVEMAADALRAEGVTVAEATQVGPAPSGEAWLGIAAMMKQAGVKRLAFMSGQVHEIELFKSSDLVVQP